MKKTILKITIAFTIFLCSINVNAQEPLLGEIKMFAGNFAPRGYLFCHGQLLSISSNTALFSLLGTNYGGDGRTTFGLPDLRGRVAMGQGDGPGLSRNSLGQKIGAELTTLNNLNLPSHSHTATVTTNTNNKILISKDPAIREIPLEGDIHAQANFGPGLSTTNVKTYGPATNTVNGQSTTTTAPTININNTGGQQPFNIIQPSSVINYIIAIQGIYPSRS